MSKRSLTIAGHRTSVSVDDDFWKALGEIAEAEDVSVAKLVERIDKTRGEKSLSGAIRSFVLRKSRG